MSYETIIVRNDDGVGLITINRPKNLNALNRQVVSELGEAVEELERDGSIRCVIVTGAGDKAFVAGGDIADFLKMGPGEVRRFSEEGQEILLKLENLGRPTIAAVNGLALGGGCELALACNLRVASETARLGLPEVGLGLIPGWGGTQRLPRLIGKGRALEIILTGEVVSAQEAFRIGLVNQLSPPERLMDTCRELADKIVNKAPLAVRYALEAVNYGQDVALPQGLEYERDLSGRCFETQDLKEGLTAFIEKRKPRFTGR